MISAITFERAIEVFTGFLVQNKNKADAKTKLLEFLDWEEPDEDSFAQDVGDPFGNSPINQSSRSSLSGPMF
jgi:hypothetical protein